MHHGLGYRYIAVVALLSALAVAQAQRPAPPPLLDPSRQPSFRSGFALDAGEYIHDVAYDRAGNIYIAGSTRNRDFPVTPNAYQTTYGGDSACDRNGCSPGDAFLLKLDPSGREIVAATYFGTTGADQFYRVLPTPQGDVLVYGYSGLHPTSPNALFAGGSGGSFLARFSPDLSRLLYFTSLPGGMSGLEFDAQGRLYLAGWFWSPMALTPERIGYSHPCPPPPGDACAYVARLNTELTKVERMATFPGSIRSMRRGADGGIWIAGYANEDWAELQDDPRAQRYPKPWPRYPDYYIAQLSAELDTLESGRRVLPEHRTWMHYGYDPSVWDFVLDRNGNLYLTGVATQNLTVTNSALQAAYAGGATYATQGDGFLLVVRPSGDLQYGTWLGTERSESGYRVLVDERGVAWVVGATQAPGETHDYEGERPCALWIVGVDPRKRRADSLVDSRCVNLPVAGDFAFYGAATLSSAGELTIATVPGRGPTIDQLETRWAVGTYGPRGVRVYQMTTRAPASLALIQQAEPTARVGWTWTLETEIRNQGSSAADDVALTLAMPDRRFSFVRAETEQGWCAFAVQLRCEVGAVAAGASVRVRLEMKPTDPGWRGYLGGFPTQVRWQGPQQEVLYNWASNPPPRIFEESADVVVTMEGYKQVVRQGETVQYTFYVENRGPDDASAVSFEVWRQWAEIASANSCVWPGCSLGVIKKGERRRFDATFTYSRLGMTSIGAAARRPGNPYYLDTVEANNYFSLPIEVVPESPEPTVLESYRYVTPYIYAYSPPWVEVHGKNIYGTSTGYWDGEARPTSGSGSVGSITLQEGDSRPGKHHLKFCSPVAGCSNVLEVQLDAPGNNTSNSTSNGTSNSKPEVQPARTRLSMRLENGVLSAPRPRRLAVDPMPRKRIDDESPELSRN